MKTMFFEISSDMCDKVIECLKTSDGVIIDHVITSKRIYEQLLSRTVDYGTPKVHVTCPLNELFRREKAHKENRNDHLR